MAEEIRNRVLIIEDEKELRLTIRGLLEADGLSCDVADDGAVGLQMAVSGDYALILLDLNLPSLRGMDICKEIRKRELPCSVLMLTARAEESDIIAGLSVGADDYVIKPFRPTELLARVRARLREHTNHMLRSLQSSSGQAAERDQSSILGELSIDPVRREIRKRGELVPLTAMEFDFLFLLAGEPGRVFARTEFLKRLWKFEAEDYAVNVSVMASRIRRKLEDDPDRPKYLFTIRGVGYKLESGEK